MEKKDCEGASSTALIPAVQDFLWSLAFLIFFIKQLKKVATAVRGTNEQKDKKSRKRAARLLYLIAKLTILTVVMHPSLSASRWFAHVVNCRVPFSLSLSQRIKVTKLKTDDNCKHLYRFYHAFPLHRTRCLCRRRRNKLHMFNIIIWL